MTTRRKLYPHWALAGLGMCLAACGGGTDTGTSTPNPTTGTTLPTDPVERANLTGSSIGYARPFDDITNPPAGTVFRFTSAYALDGSDGGGTTSFGPAPAISGRQPIYGTELANGDIRVTQDSVQIGAGGTVTLTPVEYVFTMDDPNTGRYIYTDSATGDDTYMWIRAENTYVQTVEFQVNGPASGPNINPAGTFGMIGLQTDPARLPATARYEGYAGLAVLPRIPTGNAPATDFANGTAAISVDFAGGTLGGTLSFSDAAVDDVSYDFNRNGIFPDSYDVVNASATVSGTVSGNKIEGVITSTDQMGMTGHFDGGIFGPDANELSAIGGYDVTDPAKQDTGFGPRFGGTVYIGGARQ